MLIQAALFFDNIVSKVPFQSKKSGNPEVLSIVACGNETLSIGRTNQYPFSKFLFENTILDEPKNLFRETFRRDEPRNAKRKNGSWRNEPRNTKRKFYDKNGETVSP